MRAGIQVGFFTRRGRRRAQMEDALFVGHFLVTRPMHGPFSMDVAPGSEMVAAVFDGMGGHAAGHRASALAALELADLLALGPRLDGEHPTPIADALVETGRRITDEGEVSPARARMGTTTAGCMLGQGGLTVFNVGDSRVYVPIDGYLCQQTADDAAPSGGLTQVLGGGMRDIVGHVTSAPARADPLALLCTDGLYRHVGARDLQAALGDPDPVGRLWTLSEGAADDVAVIVLDGRPPRTSVTPPVTGGSAVTAPPVPVQEPEDARPRWRARLSRRRGNAADPGDAGR